MGEGRNESANELSNQVINAAYIIEDENEKIVDGVGKSKSFEDVDNDYIIIKYEKEIEQEK